MALARFVVLLLLGATLPLLLFSPAEAGAGYWIYDANPEVLRSFANTGIKMSVMLPNENLADAARDQRYALDWARNKVAAYLPSTRIRAVQVGNEVFASRPDLTWALVPAMANVQKALADLGLADAIKVSTPVAFSAVDVSWPPSDGRFRNDLAEPVMRPMLDLLQRTGSYLRTSPTPRNRPTRSPATTSWGTPTNPGVRDPKTGLMYYSLLDAQLDATYFAMDRLGFTSLRAFTGETGSPSGGHPKHGRLGHVLTAKNGNPPAASKENAQAYNNNVINRVLSGRTGTPHRPDADMDVYIFALFNVNQKGTGPDDIEQHFSLFYPNMQKVYEFDFHGVSPAPAPPTSSWCVANAAVGDARLQAALDYACSHGADCGAIQPGAPCFEPNTMVAHFSYAFNSYYQRNHRASVTCDFAGAASVVYHAPKYGNCVVPSKTWIQETITAKSEGYAAI
ncbi:unnamed protein product [Miscanthus lutarioriparius]|uniref:X8 domain-containing protein n=1 Tax=Miscanthus lutarioriparius TaxID=422564 RepID=A0A811R9M7_9POAL|nr:unnamed protein product [Miscanthus lutarioriparius]